MNNNLFGKKIGTFFTIILCLIVAIVFWFFVKFFGHPDFQMLNALSVS